MKNVICIFIQYNQLLNRLTKCYVQNKLWFQVINFEFWCKTDISYTLASSYYERRNIKIEKKSLKNKYLILQKNFKTIRSIRFSPSPSPALCYLHYQSFTISNARSSPSPSADICHLHHHLFVISTSKFFSPYPPQGLRNLYH